MKKVLIFNVFLILLLVGFSFYVRNLFLPVSTDNKSVDFLITKGSSVAQIGNKLESSGLLRSGIVFKFYVQLTNSQSKIQAGEFQLSPNLSLVQILDQLKKGPKEIWVTIPEGLRREEVAIKFAKTLGKDNEFIKEFLTLTAGKEGYLFPDTYLFPKFATATQIVNKLTLTFERKIGDITFEQVIMASLLERETFSDSEKPIVAGVLYKRLENDWPLQVDATLQYIKGDWKPVYSIDKEIKSPFNTYKNLGLPPSPIASAGLTSLEAAKNPESSDYWYYIHDDKGTIHFAKTLEEHNVNIQKYLN
ncbi:hypothetical protein A2130_01735 [Candidatus Woesebacteria bacterium GWC2_33_12]|uniref:Endolytic murein transglycosylase n=1 Tax=Candidatus Woesebacteria bacterium GW2011_GWB1_33_22 TaxID=1618566 RepID=A0A0G0C161_9BACT|nr:MAG: Aminodeoxychorismate lyase [Candidatus Woesebacteria bacterium GW2011_GWC2_33_12]KKP42201.1 MAG: Aminodeoxychorismate lyase [Candidatus Woesebacteria bacterium GW2011_GWA2_33_20]KKP44935.1 MAG: Aminodeoxychorismate lyase [Candidatus Woesebacteria bacterium GW2011_GWB1_33_22]KKP46749.1 MAG: Aminodeoxychorismate lyase [Microgenomates group bacterium GW2011_GWC1_33_28]KKP50649.1 MAG: Aminodeoxychorismate lyase [Candidatus Woesebacteria bacterium GW2011_GWA1_33_33]OGM07792.1 MAG: hypotheti